MLRLTFENKTIKRYFSTSQAETSIYRNIYLTYMGERRSEERVKSQYYLWDLKHRIHYLYDHGPILLSDKGILWIQFKRRIVRFQKVKSIEMNTP